MTGRGSEQNLLPVQVGYAETTLPGLMGWLWTLWFSRGAPKHQFIGLFNTGTSLDIQNQRFRAAGSKLISICTFGVTSESFKPARDRILPDVLHTAVKSVENGTDCLLTEDLIYPRHKKL